MKKLKLLSTLMLFSVLCFLTGISAEANISGAIYTSLGDGTGVNINQYDYKCDVFLNGGPPPNSQNSCDQGHGLPDGCYVYQVTAPPGGGQNETLLSHDSIQNRFVKVSGGVFVQDDDGTCAEAAALLTDCGPCSTDPGSCDQTGYSVVNTSGNGYDLGHDAGLGKCTGSIPGNISVRLMPYCDTPNNGGVYKVYATKFADLNGILTGDYDNDCGGVFGFNHDNSKTDNFKVEPSVPPPPPSPKGLITIFKFCDANANGILDPINNENNLGLSGWVMSLTPDPNSCSGPTTDDGLLYCSDLDPAPYSVTETVQTGFAHTATCVDGFCGYCSITMTTLCNTDEDCLPDGGTCMPNPVNPASITITGSETHIMDFGNVGLSEINGRKFSDLNGNGSDNGEPGIAGVKILLYDAEEDVIGCQVTSSEQGKEGTYSFTGLLPGTYTVVEVKPSGTIATTPTSCEKELTVDTEPNEQGIITCAGTTEGCSFGNVCLGAGRGLTLGFWSNKNGQAAMNDGGTMNPELCMLTGLNLRNGSGANSDPCTNHCSTPYTCSYTNFRSWLLSANATNMAYMLSAQLAAMELNVEASFVSGGALVYAPGCGNTGVGNNFITISDLMNAANTELLNHPNTVANNSNRSKQECLKNALDNANNNKNFVVACPNFGATCP